MALSTPLPKTTLDDHVDQLLREREAQALSWSYGARLLFMLVGAVAMLYTSHKLADTVYTYSLMVAGLALSSWALYVASRPRKQLSRLLLIGRLGVAFDSLILVILPLSWYAGVGGSSVNPAFLLRSDLIAIIMVFLVINTMALRPLYPEIITGVSVLLLLGFAIYALPDPRVVLTNNNVEAVLGSKVKLSFFIWHIIAVFLAGMFLARLSSWARRTIRDVAEAEGAALRLMEQQAEALLTAKTSAMARVVAGLAHEINTPLAALLSSSTTMARCGTRLRDRILAAQDLQALRQDRKAQALLRLAADNEATVKSAGQRVGSLLDSLKAFSRLDAAQREEVDLAAVLGQTLTFIELPLRTGVTTELSALRPLPTVEVDVPAMNQVFLTLLRNAYEALRGSGTLTLTSSSTDDDVQLTIADDGPGIDAERLEQLFDLRFAAKQGRVGVGLGLPTARRTLEAHGGSLTVQSEPTVGTSFTVRLPR
jgi:signal transduction histidine kinase